MIENVVEAGPQLDAGARIQDRVWFICTDRSRTQIDAGAAYRPGYDSFVLIEAGPRETPGLHTGRGYDAFVQIEAGPQLDAGACIQAGGMIHLYW